MYQQTKEETYQNYKEEFKREIEEYLYTIDENTPTEEELQGALEHHLQQLKKLGATLEDDVCQVLRKAIKVAELKRKIAQRNEDYGLHLNEYMEVIEDRKITEDDI